MYQEHKTIITQNKLKEKKNACLVTSYDIRPGNGAGLFSKKKINRKVNENKK